MKKDKVVKISAAKFSYAKIYLLRVKNLFPSSKGIMGKGYCLIFFAFFAKIVKTIGDVEEGF